MGAVDFLKIGDLANNLIFIAQTNSVGYLIAAAIQDWIDDNPDECDLDMSEDDINAILKALTGCVVATRTDLSCYPLGAVTQILFDANGDPVT
jgi:hypothetical protein